MSFFLSSLSGVLFSPALRSHPPSHLSPRIPPTTLRSLGVPPLSTFTLAPLAIGGFAGLSSLPYTSNLLTNLSPCRSMWDISKPGPGVRRQRRPAGWLVERWDPIIPIANPHGNNGHVGHQRYVNDRLVSPLLAQCERGPHPTCGCHALLFLFVVLDFLNIFFSCCILPHGTRYLFRICSALADLRLVGDCCALRYPTHT